MFFHSVCAVCPEDVGSDLLKQNYPHRIAHDEMQCHVSFYAGNFKQYAQPRAARYSAEKLVDCVVLLETTAC